MADVPLVKNLKDPSNPLLQRIIAYSDDDLLEIWRNIFKIQMGAGWSTPYVYEEKVQIATEIMIHIPEATIIEQLNLFDKV